MDTKKLRQKILDLAIRGKLVPQDPNDEPASVLLERIRAEKERLIKEGKIKRSKKSSSDDEIEAPFEIPESWEWVRLKSLVSVLGDGIHGTPEYDITGGYYFINGNNLSNNKIVIKSDTKKVNEKEYQTYKKELNDKTILVSINGTIGNVGHYNNEPVILGKSACYYNLLDLSFKPYITMLMYTDFFLKYAVENATGSTIKNVSLAVMNDFLLPLPPLSEQQRIANEIERWFTLIDALESNEGDLLKTIDKAKSKILDLAIHGKLVPQDPNDEPGIELLKRINPKFESCDEVPWELPNNWCWTTIGSIFNHNTGKALNKSDSQEGLLLPYITTSNVYWNHFVLSDIKKMFFKDSEIDKCTVTKGDLLVCEGGDIGRSAIWNFDYDICIQNHIHRLRAKGDISHLLYLYVLMFYKWTDRIQGKGIGLQGLSSGLLDKLIVPLPPYAEQLRIVAKIKELFSVLDSIKESLE